MYPGTGDTFWVSDERMAVQLRANSPSEGGGSGSGLVDGATWLRESLAAVQAMTARHHYYASPSPSERGRRRVSRRASNRHSPSDRLSSGGSRRASAGAGGATSLPATPENAVLWSPSSAMVASGSFAAVRRSVSDHL